MKFSCVLPPTSGEPRSGACTTYVLDASSVNAAVRQLESRLSVAGRTVFITDTEARFTYVYDVVSRLSLVQREYPRP